MMDATHGGVRGSLEKTVHDGAWADGCSASVQSSNPDHGGRGMSISYAFLSIFITVVLLIGASYIALFETIYRDSITMVNDVTNQNKDILLQLVNQSNAQLIAVSSTSVDDLVRVVMQQVGYNMQSSLASYASTALLASSQLADFWHWGLIDAKDFDLSLQRLWWMLMEFETISFALMGTEDTDAFLAIQRITGGRFQLMLKLGPGITCKGCDPAPDFTSVYLVYLEPFAESGEFVAKKPFVTRTRTWYLAAKAGNGSNRWTQVFPYASPQQNALSSLGLSNAKLVRNENGTIVGGTCAGLQLDFITTFLFQSLTQMQNGIAAGIADPLLAHQTTGFYLGAVDARGLLLGITTNGNVTRVDDAGNTLQRLWSDGVPPGPLRDGITVVSTFWGSDWSKALAEVPVFDGEMLGLQADPGSYYKSYTSPSGSVPSPSNVVDTGFRMYPNDLGLLIATAGYRNVARFEALIIIVVEKHIYQKNLDASINTTRGQFDVVASQEISQFPADVVHNIDTAQEESTSQLQIYMVAMIAAILFFLLVGCWFIRELSRKFTQMIDSFSYSMHCASMLDFAQQARQVDHHRHPFFTEIVQMRECFEKMSASLQAFDHYVPDSVVRMVNSDKEPAKLGVEKRAVTIMFMSVIDHPMESDIFIPFFAEYLDSMYQCIGESSGTVGKYIGDAIMAFWNSPNELEEHGAAACDSALAQQACLAKLREQWAARGLPQIHARIGLSAGTVLHGNIGSRMRMEWGIIGDQVNLASRLETMGKYYGTSILLSGGLLVTLPPGRFLTRPVDRVCVYGKKEVTEVHELVAHMEEASNSQVALCKSSSAIVYAYRSRRFAEAVERAVEHAAAFPEDRVLAEVYEERCRRLMDKPPPPDWDNVHVLAGK